MNDQAVHTEAALRRDLAAAYRLVALFGWDDLVFTHITAKVPGSDHHFLINPYGMMFEEITASSLVKIDAEGNKVEDSPWPVNPAGFLIHSTIHHAREDAGCVMHTHSLNGVAVSAQKEGLLPLSQQSTGAVRGRKCPSPCTVASSAPVSTAAHSCAAADRVAEMSLLNSRWVM